MEVQALLDSKWRGRISTGSGLQKMLEGVKKLDSNSGSCEGLTGSSKGKHTGKCTNIQSNITIILVCNSTIFFFILLKRFYLLLRV